MAWIAPVVVAAGVLLSCGSEPPREATVSASPSTPTDAKPTDAAPECLTAGELRAQVQTNWEFGTRPGAEIIDTGHSVEVIVHDIDGSDYTITYDQFKASSRQAARECRANASS